MDTIRYYVPGILLILMAVLIVAMPEILVAIIASVIIMAGIGLLYVGHKMRKSGMIFRRTDERFSDDDLFGRRFARRHISEDWRRWF